MNPTVGFTIDPPGARPRDDLYVAGCELVPQTQAKEYSAAEGRARGRLVERVQLQNRNQEFKQRTSGLRYASRGRGRRGASAGLDDSSRELSSPGASLGKGGGGAKFSATFKIQA